MPGDRLSEVERAQIEVLFGEGLSAPMIAVRIGRDRSTVWRELRRNNANRGAYVPTGVFSPVGRRESNPDGWGGVYQRKYCHRHAQRKATRRAARPRPGKLRPSWGGPWPLLWQVVKAKLVERWSPQQIAAWLREEFADRPECQVSHETIYQAIYFQARGHMRQELDRQVAMRSGRTRRRPQSRGAGAGRSNRPWVRDFHISTRPAQATDRAVPGHWEGDLVIGTRGSSAIITLVERASRFVMLGALPHSRVSEEVIDVLIRLMSDLPAQLRQTLTWDQGNEMAAHADFTLATDCKVYFCDPHAPWQRGSNENTNGLLRQYFPRSTTDFRALTQADLNTVAHELNGRPRQTLGWRNPTQALNDLLVATTT